MAKYVVIPYVEGQTNVSVPERELINAVDNAELERMATDLFVKIFGSTQELIFEQEESEYGDYQIRSGDHHIFLTEVMVFVY